MREEELFHAAVAKSGSERAAFLDQVCAGKAPLRAAVEALLAAHEASGSFLNLPPNPPAAKPLKEDPAETQDSGLAANGNEAATGEHVVGSAGFRHARGSEAMTADLRQNAEVGVVIAGRYTLQEKIGEGGMGEVWVAKQTQPVKRKVALKLIKTGMDSRGVLQRFEQERQALALMDHPNIASVLDGGMTPTGQPFFVMELVNGLSLTKFCDELKLPLKERLELFVPICQAVQHAHQKGIVHRDLKPANILVTMIDGKPVPKVIDFGVAKATAGKLTEETMSTGFGAIVGTLEYMSPEQAGFSGEDIDTRADIYSLGVILYELLTGLRPIDGKRLKQAALTEMIRIIREEEPSKPSTRLSTDESLPSLAAARHIEPRKLTALLRGELDWVVMKCLEKHRERRYETANGLARDIQRYLSDEAVEARPPSAGYRLQKFIHRNRVMVTAVSAVAAALVIGIIGFAWQASVANYQRVLADKARESAEEQRDRAVAAEKETLQRAAELEKVSEYQSAMLTRIDMTKAGQMLSEDIRRRYATVLSKEGLSGAELEARELSFAKEWERVNSVDTAVGFIDREILLSAVTAVDEQFRDQPLVDARLRRVLAGCYAVLGRWEDSIKLNERALEIRRKELGNSHPNTIDAMIELASSLHMGSRIADAEVYYRESLKSASTTLGDENGDHSLLT